MDAIITAGERERRNDPADKRTGAWLATVPSHTRIYADAIATATPCASPSSLAHRITLSRCNMGAFQPRELTERLKWCAPRPLALPPTHPPTTPKQPPPVCFNLIQFIYQTSMLLRIVMHFDEAHNLPRCLPKLKFCCSFRGGQQKSVCLAVF